MNLRVGVDIVSVERFERARQRWGHRFLRRVFTEAELQECQGRIQSLAARFAAKEAVMKVLGTGYSNGICWRDIEIRRDGAEPTVILKGQARRRAHALGLLAWALSLTHDNGVAIAVAVGYGVTHDANTHVSKNGDRAVVPAPGAHPPSGPFIQQRGSGAHPYSPDR